MKESDYGYSGNDNSCKSDDQKKAIKVTSTESCSGCSFDDWYNILSNGPMYVKVDASSSNFQNYSSGTLSLDSSECTSINHAMVALGYYDIVSGILLIRNSWGSSWGNDGLLFTYRDDNTNKSCFLTKYAYRPDVSLESTCVVYYKGANYSGDSKLVCAREGTSSLDYNNNMESIKVGPNTRAILFTDSDCSGSSYSFTSDKSSFPSSFQNTISSMALEPTDIDPDCIRVYDGKCFGGKYLDVCSNVRNLDGTGLNDDISSVLLGSNIDYVELYKHSSYSGTVLTFTSDQYTITSSMNNEISSIKIFVKPTPIA